MSTLDRDAPPPHAIGFDIGGTKIAAGVIASDGTLVEDVVVIPTPNRDGDAVLQAVLELVEKIRVDHPDVSGVGVGAAGLVDWPNGSIRWAPNNAYRDLPLQQQLTDLTGLPAVVENDANAAAWAEACIGRGRGHRNIVVLTVGTGIGGGLILNGDLYRGATGLAGEIGHLSLDPVAGPVCGCGATGCLESLASGNALGRAGRALAATHPTGRLAMLAGSPEDVTGRIVHLAALEGDHDALGAFEQVGGWLGVGIASLVTTFDPELVVLAGGLAEAGDLLLAPARASFRRHVFAGARRSLPPVVPAVLGPEAGIIGAGLLALR